MLPSIAVAILLAGPGVSTPIKIAVLEFRNPAGLAEQEVDYITDLARSAAARLPPTRYFVMTRENILEQLPPDTDLATCVGECEVETGRNVGADLVLTGEVVRFGRSLRTVMRLHDTRTGRLVGTERASGKEVDALEGPVEQAATRLLGRVTPQAASPPPGSGRIGETPQAWEPAGQDPVLVRFASDPPGAVVVVDDRVLCRDTRGGCARNIAPGPHRVSMQLEDYEPRTEQVVAAPGLEVDWKLVPDLALVSVVSDPPGLEVLLGGKSVGKSPLKGHRVPPGVHELLVTSPCHYDSGERVELKRGESRRISVELKPREAAIEVTAADADGNAVGAEVRVDGEAVGTTPGTFKVSLCSKRVEVRHGRGRWSEVLSLKERQVKKLAAKLRGGERTKAVPGGGSQEKGFCSKKDIVRVVRRRANLIRMCYERRLQVSPQLHGKVIVKWHILATGRVGEAEVVQTTLGDRAVSTCMLRIIETMRFAKPTGGICVVRWPFVFSQGQ